MSRILLLTFVFLVATPVFAQVQEDDVVGIWVTDDGKANVEIYKKGAKFYGKIIWLKEPNEEDGTPKLDDENPDKELQSKPILGLNMLSGFVFKGDEWVDGKIYDPETGKTYSCYMEFKGVDRLKIRGYIGFSLLGETTYWTRKQ
ncbi:MAG: DUF2147 domain-containing protein [Bacteroidia bacterium]|nr:DUF2147 domain-containing protein [Bacteroidia bacterium]